MRQTQFRFYFDLGVPVYDFPTGKTILSFRWRTSKKTVNACSMLEAIRKLVTPVIQKHTLKARLNLTRAWKALPKGQSKPGSVLSDGAHWIELDLSKPTLAAFLIGASERDYIQNIAKAEGKSV